MTDEKGQTVSVGSSDLFGDVKIHSHRQEMLMVDATPDEDYPLRILSAYLENATATRVESNPPALGEMMNKWQDERAAILRRAIERLSSPNVRMSEGGPETLK
jgi:hypothetical protein